MDVLHPRVVGRGLVVLDVLLELDHVGVGDLLGSGGGDDGSSIFVDSADVEGGQGSCVQR